MLFQGQEFGASSPFDYFSDMSGDLREAIRVGRFNFLSQFPSMAGKDIQSQLFDPSDPKVFARCKLDFSERETNKQFYDLHCDLIKLRREDPRFHEQKKGGLDGAVLGPASFVFRYFGDDGDRLLVVNLGKARPLAPAPEPLLAPPFGFRWETLWTSDSPRYGGPGPVQLVSQEHWLLPADAAVALHPVRETAPRKEPRKR
jgi:maltooligosyltrehalose trehalohydrolase